jgi:putative DNA primase/helicase
MTAEEIAYVLGEARLEGCNWRCRCPLHGGKSLTLRDGKEGRLLVTCWGGCDRRDILAELRARGLINSVSAKSRHHGVLPQSRPPANDQRDRGSERRAAVALEIWRSAVPAANTLVETYLLSRGIKLTLPASLRFHPALRHRSGGLWPAMIGLVRGSDDEPVAIHRTFLARDGRDKAPVVPQKMMLGPCLGGAVRLGNANPDGWLMLAEGIETTLSVMQAYGLPGWAALSSSGLRNLTLPPAATMVLACADNDANDVGQRAAHGAAERFLREGRRVRMATPPTPGMDFNDMQSAPTQFAESARHEH